ncbi:MAG: T9SS type B sorting domain-containing protein [Pricia sp.]|nr:T9SS type B sorting domain-containing protein [Pricia sp.]
MVLGFTVSNAQFLLQAPNSGDETNYRWYEASNPTTVLGTDFFYEVTQRGVYFATYDGTLCGHNATGYFIVTNCNSPYNEVTLDISANPVPSGATLSWSPSVTGDQTRPTVIATQTVVKYTATLSKAGNSKSLPNFTVVCMDESATLVDDSVAVNEDESVVIEIYVNDSDLPTTGTLTISDPPDNGIINLDNGGTPNDPTDDIVTYIPNPNFNGFDTFDYTVCNSFGDCSTANVAVDVIPIVDANDDTVATNENVALDIDILANDNDIPFIGTLTTTNPSDGTIVLNNGGSPTDPSDDYITYTPDIGFLGTDSFTYTLCDNLGNCSVATVTIMVNPLGTDLDTDDDGIVDSFEDLNLDGDSDPSTNPTDTDFDGIPDYLDIDSDNDGIPDNVEAQSTVSYLPPSELDTNGNGLDDAYESTGMLGIIPEDTDNDSLPDYVDEDSDNDNVPDNIEGHDHDQNGIPDVVLIGSDKDNDGLDDGYEGSSTIDLDVNDEINDPFNDLPNTDGDGESDYRDMDDDDDGIESKDEDTNTDGNYANDDSDNDGIPEYLEPNIVDTEVDVINVVTPNDDGQHDTLRIDGIENYPNNTVRIYNRWGVLVFNTNAYDNLNNNFDGTSQGRVTVDASNKLPVGTYFYILDYEDSNGNMITDTGYIYINR